MVAYKSSILSLRPHAPIFKQENAIKTLAGLHINQNQVHTNSGIEICQKLESEEIAAPGQKNLAWIFHRIQHSELEYVYRLFKVHANEVQDNPYFKSNRSGFRVPEIKRKLKKFYKSILPDTQVSLYHSSLENFNKINGLEPYLSESISSMTEAAIWEKVRLIPHEILYRDHELTKRIFSGTRFHDWIIRRLKEKSSDK